MKDWGREKTADIQRNPVQTTQGLDGMLGNDFVELKTITPDKGGNDVRLKRAGNLGNLVVVKISDDFQFAARMVDRRLLGRNKGKWATLSWSNYSG